MATRTWRGTINSNWDVAGNWLEGVVPIAGDDVIFDANSNDCVLSSNVPATGRLQSIDFSGYTNTLYFGDYKINVGSGAYVGTILNFGSTGNFQCNTSGGLRLYSNSMASSGQNIILGTNTNSSNVNLFLYGYGGHGIFDAQDDFYCNNITIEYWRITFTDRNKNIYVLGEISELSGFNNSNSSLILRKSTLYLQGSGNILLNNTLTIYAPIYIKGNYTLQQHLTIAISNTSNNNAGIYYLNGGAIHCNDYKLMIRWSGSPYPCYINIPSIDSLVINTFANTSTPIILPYNIEINKYLELSEAPTTRTPYCIFKSPTNGVKSNIILGPNCRFLISGCKLQDLAFSRPVIAFNSTINNCENIINYPSLPFVDAYCS